MKKLINAVLILFVTACLSTKASGQFIQSLTVIPPNPTTADTITVLADCMFPSGGCDEHTQYSYIFGQDLYAGALHCLGMLSVICQYTDTFIVEPLPAGAYTFHFQLDAGALPSPCTPGIVAGPNDSVAFIVSPAVAIQEYISNDAVSVFPNPFTEQFQMTGFTAENYPLQVEIFSPEGKLVKSITVNESTTSISVKEFPPAVYQVRIRKNNGEQVIVPALKK